jgi:hypothetical protein
LKEAPQQNSLGRTQWPEEIIQLHRLSSLIYLPCQDGHKGDEDLRKEMAHPENKTNISTSPTLVVALLKSAACSSISDQI